MLKELTKSILIYGVASSIGKSIGLFLVPIYTRIFTPEQYGIIDLIATIVALISILGMAQLESAISRYYFSINEKIEKQQYVSTAFWTIVFLSAFWSVFVFFTAKPLSLLLFKTHQYRNVIFAASLIIPFSNIFSYLTVLMRYIKKPIAYTFFVSIHLISTVAVSIWLVMYERIGIVGVFYGQLFGYFLTAVVMLYYLRFLLSFYWDWRILKRFLRYSLPMLPAVAVNWLNSRANRFVMLGYLTLADIGLYTIAVKIASVFIILDSAFRMAWGPFRWENFQRPDHREIYRSVMIMVTSVVFLLVIILAFFGKEILLILATPEYANAGQLVGLLIFSFALGIVTQTINLGAGIVKRTEFNTITYTTSVAVNIIGLFLLVPRIGLLGVPISLLVSTSALVALVWWNSEYLYYVGFSKTFFLTTYVITLLVVAISVMTDLSLFLRLLMITFFILSLGAFFIHAKNPFVWAETVNTDSLLGKRN